MFKTILSYFVLPVLLLSSNSWGNSAPQFQKGTPGQSTGTLEKMIVASGSVAMDLDLNRLNKSTKDPQQQTLRFDVAANSFFTVLVSNKELRGLERGSMGLVPKNAAGLPQVLNASIRQLVVEQNSPGEAYDTVVRDGKTGFTFFNIEGVNYDYDAHAQLLSITGGRLLISREFADSLGRPSDAGAVAGEMSINATLQTIETIQLDENGDVKSARLPAQKQPGVGTVPGPDVIIGELIGLDQSQNGSVLGRVGLALGTDACNKGTVDVDWFSLPNADHPFIPQNLYRMSGGADNTQRFEQIGQSWGKHAFTAASSNTCGYGCNGVGGSHLGSGCSDAYGSGLNGSQTGIGSRAWVNPFTGVFNGSIANNHTDHTHDVTSHRILVDVTDLSTSQNPGAVYFAEAQYIVPHEYAWCQSHPGQCNMYNNASYRRYTVTGTGQPFSFSSTGFPTVREQPAIMAWTGAMVNQIKPDPLNDGIGFVGYKVTDLGGGVWHYEYAVYNQNLDRSIQSFSVPVGCGVTVSNLGFHMPPQQPAFSNDGTQNSAGYSSARWPSTLTSNALTWNSATFADDQNANAIRFGTLYNFRFDANRPPQNVNATIGYFKTGSPTTVAIQGPMPATGNPLQLTSAVSRKSHGPPGTFDVDLPLSGNVGIESRSGGAGGNHTFVITFSNPVVSGNASVTSGAGKVFGSPTFSGNTMTVNLTGVSDAQQITVTLSNVTDCFGSVSPDAMVTAGMLIGDTSSNRAVNSGDVGQSKSRIGQPVNAATFRSDVNADGSLNASDVSIVKSKIGNGLP